VRIIVSLYSFDTIKKSQLTKPGATMTANIYNARPMVLSDNNIGTKSFFNPPPSDLIYLAVATVLLPSYM
jgi:hypothetical protein